MTDNAVSWQRAVGVLKEDRVTDVTQVGEYYNFIAAIMVVPDCIKDNNAVERWEIRPPLRSPKNR